MVTKYYCYGDVCKTKRKRQPCCLACINRAWCRITDEWPGCVPWMCGKSAKETDYYFRYYARHGVNARFLLRKCKRRRLEGKK